ncbi:MAG: hypothetical protein QOG10_7149, partial [Kribbellaceae bacterium]|nr:hypothetical protein [Kribbellaceae bacterium]
MLGPGESTMWRRALADGTLP